MDKGTQQLAALFAPFMPSVRPSHHDKDDTPPELVEKYKAVAEEKRKRRAARRLERASNDR